MIIENNSGLWTLRHNGRLLYASDCEEAVRIAFSAFRNNGALTYATALLAANIRGHLSYHWSYLTVGQTAITVSPGPRGPFRKWKVVDVKEQYAVLRDCRTAPHELAHISRDSEHLYIAKGD